MRSKWFQMRFNVSWGSTVGFEGLAGIQMSLRGVSMHFWLFPALSQEIPDAQESFTGFQVSFMWFQGVSEPFHGV